MIFGHPAPFEWRRIRRPGRRLPDAGATSAVLGIDADGAGTATRMGDRKKEPDVGDEVTWRSHGSTAEGRVEKKVTDRRKEAGRTVAASPEEPQYVVRSEKSGKKAVHKGSALRKRRGSK